MTRISGSTFFFKKLFPALWFGFLAFFLLAAAPASGGESILFYIVPIVMAVFGYQFFRKFAWDLADEVYDAGDRLIFRKGGQEQIVRLDEITNISFAQMSSPERVTIHVRSPGLLGKELAFSLPVRANPFSKSPLVSDLIERVDKARRP